MPSVVLAGFFALIVGIIAAIVIGIVVFILGLVFGKKIFKKNAWLKSLPIALFVALIGGCAIFWVLGNALMSSFYPPSPGIKPAEQDIVGIWQLTQGSLESMKEEGYTISTHTLEFKADGTFRMTNLPDLVWHFGTVGGKFESGSGNWSIEKDINGDWCIELSFTELNGATENLRTEFYLYGKKPPYLIYDYIGDPDDGWILTYERR